MWGLLDTVDNVWLGNDRGPVLYLEQDTAQISAQVQAVRLGLPCTRIRAEQYPDDAPAVLRDKVDLSLTTEEALEAIEEGRVR